MNKSTRQQEQLAELERAAIDAHRDGIAWAEFARRYWRLLPRGRRLGEVLDRLLHLVASGDGSGEQHPAGDADAWDWNIAPWIMSDEDEPEAPDGVCATCGLHHPEP